MAYGAILGQNPLASNIPYSGTAQGATVKEGLDGLQTSVNELNSDIGTINNSIEELNSDIQEINTTLNNVGDLVYEYKSSAGGIGSISLSSSKNFSYALVNILPAASGNYYYSGSYLIGPSQGMNCAILNSHGELNYQLSATNQTITIANITGQGTTVKVIFFY